MSSHTSEAVAAFRDADPVAADAYADAAYSPEATATMRQIMATPVEKRQRPKRAPIAFGVTATAAAAITVAAIASGTPGNTSHFRPPGKQLPPVSNAAYSVRTNQDGSVTAVVRDWRNHLPELSKELQRRGAPILPPANPPDVYRCHYKPTGPQHSFREPTNELDATDNTFTVWPDRIPDDVYLEIQHNQSNNPNSSFSVQYMASSTWPTLVCPRPHTNAH